MAQIVGIVTLTTALLAVVGYVFLSSRWGGLVALWPRRAEPQETTELTRDKIKLELELARHRQMEQALRDSEERYRVVVEHGNDIIIIAQDGVMKFVNPRGELVLGYNRYELAQMPFSNLIAPDDREIVLDRYRRRLKGEEVPHRYTFRALSRAGEMLWVEINTVPVDWEGRPATLSFLRDVTDHVRAEERIVETQRAAESAEQARHEWITQISRELRDSLEGLVEHAEHSRESSVDDEQRRRVDCLLEATQRLQAVLDQLERTLPPTSDHLSQGVDSASMESLS